MKTEDMKPLDARSSGYAYVSATMVEKEDLPLRANLMRIPYKNNPDLCDHQTAICAGKISNRNTIAAAVGDTYCAESWSHDYILHLGRTYAGRVLRGILDEHGVRLHH